MPAVIDLNCDVGEGAGLEPEIFPWITSANVACGLHAGDPATMRRLVELARRHGVAVGAHPGFPDRASLGRREMSFTLDELEALVAYQVGALSGICRAAGVPLRHVKLHGALYHLAARDRRTARTVALSVRALDPALILVAPPGSALAEAGKGAGLRVALEGFADRAYAPDGTLVPRTEAGAVLAGPRQAAEQACRLAAEGRVETLCLHGDHPRAAEAARAVRRALAAAGFAVKPL